MSPHFFLNPNALSEISLPTSYLLSRPWYHSGITNSEIASNFSSDVEIALASALSAGGGSSLVDFSPFPGDTTYTPSSLSVVFVDQAAANIAGIPECFGEPPTTGCTVNGVRNQPCIGSPGRDTIRGTKGNDVIVGLDGGDAIGGDDGDDLICGGAGRDTIRGTVETTISTAAPTATRSGATTATTFSTAAMARTRSTVAGVWTPASTVSRSKTASFRQLPLW
jgi:hypothetical protein